MVGIEVILHLPHEIDQRVLHAEGEVLLTGEADSVLSGYHATKGNRDFVHPIRRLVKGHLLLGEFLHGQNAVLSHELERGRHDSPSYDLRDRFCRSRKVFEGHEQIHSFARQRNKPEKNPGDHPPQHSATASQPSR